MDPTRNKKENFEPVDTQEVLARVLDLPVTEWNYIIDSDDIRHIGPMAQDFHAAFPETGDDKTLNTIDEAGVALVAIQGLHQNEQAKDAKIAALKKKLKVLKGQVDEMEEESRRWEARFSGLLEAVLSVGQSGNVQIVSRQTDPVGGR